MKASSDSGSGSMGMAAAEGPASSHDAALPTAHYARSRRTCCNLARHSHATCSTLPFILPVPLSWRTCTRLSLTITITIISITTITACTIQPDSLDVFAVHRGPVRIATLRSTLLFLPSRTCARFQPHHCDDRGSVNPRTTRVKPQKLTATATHPAERRAQCIVRRAQAARGACAI